MGTRKKTLPHTPKEKKEKKNKIAHECMPSVLIVCLKFLFSKIVCHHFWHGPLARAQTMRHIAININ